MITNRTMPSSVNVFQITVRRGIADGSLQGCVKSHSLGLQAQFSSLSRMVILMEEWLDFAVPVPPCKPENTPLHRWRACNAGPYKLKARLA